MKTQAVTKRNIFIVTCETKHRKKFSSVEVLGVFADEKTAQKQADALFQTKRQQFLGHIRKTSNFKPVCLEDREDNRVVSYWPSGSWDMKEHVKIHVTPNRILTDL